MKWSLPLVINWTRLALETCKFPLTNQLFGRRYSHFECSLGALVYSDEKMARIVITQSIKCFLEERNSRNIFLDEEKKIIPNYFFILNLSAKHKNVCRSPTKFFEKGSKVSLKFPWNRTKKSLKFFSIFCNISAKYSPKYFQNFPKNSQKILEFNWNF